MFVTAKKYKELEDKLVQQERLFELERTNLKNEIEDLNYTLKFAQANEQSLNAMTGSLSNKLLKFEAFPDKKFNIDKAIEVLTTKLTPKALATFLHKLVEELGDSHVVSLNNYVLKRLTTINSKENVNN